MEEQADPENRGQTRDREGEEEDRPTKRHRAEYIEVLYAKVESLAKQRARKEVTMRKENDPEKIKFQKAIAKEIKNNFTSKAYELISLKESEQVRREKADKVMKSRYVLTRKPCEPEDIASAQAEGILLDDETDGPHKAKARHVMQGYSENGSEELDSTTPQVAKDSVIFTLQILCSMGWEIGNLDFTQAFHSGDPIERELYCEQPKEGVPGAQPRQLLRLLKTCYGLTDGPYAWYKHVTKVLKGLGYVQSLADPCMFYLYAEDELPAGQGEGAKVPLDDTECQRPGQGLLPEGERSDSGKLCGIIALATDDMLHGGDYRHWQNMEILRSRYKMGKFATGGGRFVGKEIEKNQDGSFLLHQQFYTQDKMEAITISRERKRHRYSKCDDKEISELYVPSWADYLGWPRKPDQTLQVE